MKVRSESFERNFHIAFACLGLEVLGGGEIECIFDLFEVTISSARGEISE
jgi:hypothetical protein